MGVRAAINASSQSSYDLGGWLLGWMGLAIAVVVLNGYPGTAPVVRYTLLAVIAYVLLTNADALSGPLGRWVADISAGPTAGAGVSRVR